MSRLKSSLYVFGEFYLDGQNRLLRREDEPIPLTPKAFELLRHLVEHAGEVVTKDDLMSALWPDSFVEESNLTQTVFMVRKALGETPQRRYILTVQGRGYRFVPPVREIRDHHGDEEAADAVIGAAQVKPLSSEPAQKPGALARTKRSAGILVSAAVSVVALGVLLSAFRLSGSRSHTNAAAGRSMLAVLPFENLTGYATDEYFSDGLTEEMISQLGNLDPQRLGVIARTSVMHYKNTQVPLSQIGRELAVQYVIEGSVRRDANKVRVTAQLIQVKDQAHVWARQYDRELNGLLTLQGEVAHEIADEIQLTLGDRKPAATPLAATPHNYEAYDLYLKGQYFFNKRTLADLKEAIGYFERSVAKDPAYARAYAGLADCYALLGGYAGQGQAEFVAKGRAAALHALQLDHTLAEAHTALALIVQNYDWDWQTAEQEFRRAIELNPNYTTAHHWYAEHLMWRGRFEEALEESEKARQLDPLSLIIAADNGAILYFSRQYDRAMEKWYSVEVMDPFLPRAHLIVGAYTEKGMYAEALADIQRMRSRNIVQGYLCWQAYIYGRSGKQAQAHQALRELLLWSRSHPVDPMNIAWAYLGMGDRERTLAWLEKAWAQHSTELVSLKVNPGFDPLRSDPRFNDLERRVGLAQ